MCLCPFLFCLYVPKPKGQLSLTSSKSDTHLPEKTHNYKSLGRQAHQTINMPAHKPPHCAKMHIPMLRIQGIISVAILIGIYSRLALVHHSVLQNCDHDLQSISNELPQAKARVKELIRQVRYLEKELSINGNNYYQHEESQKHSNGINQAIVSSGADDEAAELHGQHDVHALGTANVTSSTAADANNHTAISSRFAYVYIIAGCTPSKPIYRYYIYDILVSTQIQRRAGSTADVIVYVQMAHEAGRRDLPLEDERLFQALNIRIIYLQPTPHESFHRTMLDKFRVLQLVEYERVLFMDSDVMPRTSLDYLFDLSVKGVLQESLVVAGGTEPANGGFFMLKPKPDSWKQLLRVVRRKEERGKSLPYPHFDDIIGWGHPFGENDYYELFRGKRGNKWNFYGAFSDQGLLYHWCKYETQSVSIVLKYEVRQWGSNNGTSVLLRSDLVGDILNGYTPKNSRCKKGRGNSRLCNSPYSDFIHYTGKTKPWLLGPPSDYLQNPKKSDAHFWFSNLHELNSTLGMDLDFASWKKIKRMEKRPLLGYFPLHADASKANYASTAEGSK